MKPFLAAMAAGAVVVVAPGARAQTPTTVTAAIGSNMNHVPSFVGVEKGIFLKHGVDVKLKILSTGQEMSKALQAGGAQLVCGPVFNFSLAVQGGMTVKGVHGSMCDRTTIYSDETVIEWSSQGSGMN